MEIISEKDKEILYQLDNNSRIPFRQLAKNVNLPENTLRYRIEQFEEKIIINYYTRINSYNLGFNSVKFYTKLKKVNSQIKKEMIRYFCMHKDTWVVSDVEGEFDLVAIFWFRNINEFFLSWQQILYKFSKYLLNPTLYFQIEAISFRPTFLINIDKRPDNEPFEITKTSSIIKIDNIENNILQILASSARLQTVKIASKLNLTSNIVNNRIKKLMKNDVIQSYNLNFDISKLGYMEVKVDIFLTEYKFQNKIISYIKTCPNLVCIMRSIGRPHIELEFNVKSFQHFHDIITNLIDNNSNAINNYTYFYVLKKHKLRWMPIINQY
jgi:DNA-binding Lrp family transcriptional regulator